MNTHFKTYCCGFAKAGNKVLLIRKNRPTWQAGKLNGIGGHVEEGETIWEAMVREFREETGLETKIEDWNYFVFIKNKNYALHFFSIKVSEEFIKSAKSMTDEPVELVDASILPSDVINNLRWLIPLSNDDLMVRPMLLETITT